APRRRAAARATHAAGGRLARAAASRDASPVDLADALTLARDCADLRRTRQPDRVDSWRARAATRALSALQRYAQGLRDDSAAVRAGGTRPWSNGPVEGHINRLQRLKRQMFGRAHLDLLSRRCLLAPRERQAQATGSWEPAQAHPEAAAA